MNKAFIVGNVGNDPEFKQVGESGVLNISVATSERFKDRNGELQEKTEWHRINYWGKGAEGLSRILQKGHKVAVEGSIHTREYDKDGMKRYTTEIKAFNVELLERKQRQADSGGDNW